MRQLTLYTLLAVGAVLFLLWANPAWLDTLGEAGTALVRPVVIPLVELINKPSFVYVLSTLILVAAFVCSVAYWGRVVRPRLHALRRLQAEVRRLPLPGAAKGEGAPAALRGLGEALRRAELFPVAWAGFQSEAAREGGVPAAPFRFFAGGDPTVDEGERRGLMQALPGYFTSLGLILTFVGLVVALYFAAKGFRSGNIEEARGAILQLLNASSFKFLTSVAALVAALGVSLVLRVSLSVTRHETDDTLGLIESYISAWRATEPPRDGLRSPVLAVTERLDRLIGAVAALAERLESSAQAAAQASARAAQPSAVRGPAE